MPAKSVTGFLKPVMESLQSVPENAELEEPALMLAKSIEQ